MGNIPPDLVYFDYLHILGLEIPYCGAPAGPTNSDVGTSASVGTQLFIERGSTEADFNPALKVLTQALNATFKAQVSALKLGDVLKSLKLGLKAKGVPNADSLHLTIVSNRRAAYLTFALQK